MLEISLYLKLSSIALLLFASSKLFFAGRFSARAIASGLFTLSIAGYLGCQISHGSTTFTTSSLSVPYWLIWFVHVGCFGVPLTFYLLTESLFEDKFQFRFLHLVLFLFIESVNFYLIVYLKIYVVDDHFHGSESATLVRALPQTISLAFILVALFRISFKRRTDLVEVRRNFRLKFIIVSSVYMLLVLISELAYQGKKAPALLDLMHSIGILLTVWYFASKIFIVKSGTLGEIKTIAKKNTDTPEGRENHKELLAKLDKAMREEKVFTQESLSIRELAKHLQIHEYVLRRLINSALGYRNFNDYLNGLRINDACDILSDKNQQSLPIIRIAMDLGFGSLAPFNKAFKERKGVTPTDYRRTALS